MAKDFIHSEGFIESLYDDPGLIRATQEAAGRVAEQVRETAPKVSGDYARSIHVEKSPRPGRPTFRVVADVPYAMAVEARTGNLARGVR